MTPQGETPDRVRAAIRRHGLARRPRALRAFLKRHGLRFAPGNRVEIFTSGAPALSAMLLAIESAQSRVHLETYIFRSDRIGRRFVEALTERARRGVVVRVIYDAFGSLSLDATIFRDLLHAGGQVVAFNPLRRFYPRWLPRRRDHRKILTVDGRIGFLGGLNVGDEYNTEIDAPRGWRDTHACVEGPVVRDLEAVFLESWFRADGPDLPWGQILSLEPEPRGSDRCAIVPDGPSYRRRMTRELVCMGIRTAQHNVRLTTAYFAPGRRLLHALVRAAERGVSVELLLAGSTDHPILRRAARALLPRLLRAGVRVSEYHGPILHAKTGIFDERWAIIGTSNLDRQSFEHSYEVNLVVAGGAVPERLAAIFAEDQLRCVPINEAALAERNIFERVVDRLAAALLWVV